jgi:hypothetical protein
MDKMLDVRNSLHRFPRGRMVVGTNTKKRKICNQSGKKWERKEDDEKEEDEDGSENENSDEDDGCSDNSEEEEDGSENSDEDGDSREHKRKMKNKRAEKKRKSTLGEGAVYRMIKQQQSILEQPKNIAAMSKKKEIHTEQIRKKLKDFTRSMTLSKEQFLFLQKVSMGDNVFLTGAGGGGKSYVLKILIAFLKELNWNVVVTAYTSTACKQLPGAITFHSFLGLGAKYFHRLPPVEQFVKELLDKPFSHCTQRWLKCDVLIIDEISMVHSELFTFFEQVATSLRTMGGLKNNDDHHSAFKKQSAAGGIFLVAAGDFYQLGPTQRTKYNNQKTIPILRNSIDNTYDIHTMTSYSDSNVLQVQVPLQLPSYEPYHDVEQMKCDVQKKEESDEKMGPYCFQCLAWERLFGYTAIILKKVFRQTDEAFIHALNELRCGCLSDSSKYLLLTRVLPPNYRQFRWRKNMLTFLAHVVHDETTSATTSNENETSSTTNATTSNENETSNSTNSTTCNENGTTGDSITWKIPGQEQDEKIESKVDVEDEEEEEPPMLTTHIVKVNQYNDVRLQQLLQQRLDDGESDVKTVTFVPKILPKKIVNAGGGGGIDKGKNKNKNINKMDHENNQEFTEKEKEFILSKTAMMDNRPLTLTIGARVMITVNIDLSCGLYNGSCGSIVSYDSHGVVLKLDDDHSHVTVPFYSYVVEGRPLLQVLHIPLILAYAITIHKIQGASLKRAIIDVADAFEGSQVYVALSRVTSLSGLYIESIDFDKVAPPIIVQHFYEKLHL